MAKLIKMIKENKIKINWIPKNLLNTIRKIKPSYILLGSSLLKEIFSITVEFWGPEIFNFITCVFHLLRCLENIHNGKIQKFIYNSINQHSSKPNDLLEQKQQRKQN